MHFETSGLIEIYLLHEVYISANRFDDFFPNRLFWEFSFNVCLHKYTPTAVNRFYFVYPHHQNLFKINCDRMMILG